MNKPRKQYIKLWLKFKPDYQFTQNGTAIHKNRYNGTEKGRKQAFKQFLPYLKKLITADKLSQARIYDTQDNSLLYQWPENN